MSLVEQGNEGIRTPFFISLSWQLQQDADDKPYKQRTRE